MIPHLFKHCCGCRDDVICHGHSLLVTIFFLLHIIAVVSFHYISIHGMINNRILKNGGNHLAEQQKTRVTVDIYGQQYTIVGTESSSHIRLVASIVDDKMREISEKNPTLDISKLAVLTAVNVVHDYIKLKEEYDRLLQKLHKEKDE